MLKFYSVNLIEVVGTKVHLICVLFFKNWCLTDKSVFCNIISYIFIYLDYRLYSCLANGSADEFLKGDHLYKARAVKDALQIGQ